LLVEKFCIRSGKYVPFTECEGCSGAESCLKRRGTDEGDALPANLVDFVERAAISRGVSTDLRMAARNRLNVSRLPSPN